MCTLRHGGATNPSRPAYSLERKVLFEKIDLNVYYQRTKIHLDALSIVTTGVNFLMTM